ncbi:lipopolysaccharide biosynthesis protein [Serinibacter arcticus]|uniref:lipopolysaccharide biosynthesis protein n=1 Tax=Serinibacter arcticus TaxID=1655435 RepID=UPI001092B69A|nr:lipopolysaccharide biosynthesis protein [Serinibacter arcticus]
MNLATAAARGGAATLLGQLVRLVIQFASVTILARLISPADFGSYAMVFAVVGVASVLADFGLSMASIQAREISFAQRSNLFWTNTAIGLGLYVVFVLCAPLLSAFYGRDELTELTRVLALTFVFNAVAAQLRAELARRLKFKNLALADIVAALIGLIAGLSLGLLGAGYWALVWQQVAISLGALVVLAVFARWRPGLPRSGVPMRDLYRYGANTLGVQIFIYATSNLDSVLIGRSWGASALGLYDRSYQLFRLPLQQIAAPMTKVGVPVLSRLQDDARYEDYLVRAQTLMAYVMGGSFFFLFSVSGPLIDVLLGDQWTGAKPIFAILAIAGVFQSITYVYSWVFLSLALTSLQLKWTIIGRTAMVGLMVVGLPFGPTGVAVGVAAGHLLNWGLLTAFPIARTGIRRSRLLATGGRALAVCAPVAVLCAVVVPVLLGEGSAWAKLFLATAIWAVFILGAGLFKPVRSDYSLIRDTASRAIKRRKS